MGEEVWAPGEVLTDGTCFCHAGLCVVPAVGLRGGEDDRNEAGTSVGGCRDGAGQEPEGHLRNTRGTQTLLSSGRACPYLLEELRGHVPEAGTRGKTGQALEPQAGTQLPVFRAL